MNNLIVLTARMESERLPGKALVAVHGKPNLARIIERFRKCKQASKIIVATTTRKADDAIAEWCRANGIECQRGMAGDVIGQVYQVARDNNASYTLRATADCPFISWELVDMGFAIVAANKADTARIWGVPDRIIPIYGAAEFPYSFKSLEDMDRESQGEERQHPGMRIDNYRQEYKVIYPVPQFPLNQTNAYWDTFLHPYRLELDTLDDLKLVENVITNVGELPPLHHVVRYLDAHPDVAQLNASVSEKTGQMTSFSSEQRATWKTDQTLNKTVAWGKPSDWAWLTSGSPMALPKYAKPVYCSRGECYVGYSLRSNDKVWRLYRADGMIVTGRATVPCSCGAGREWFADGEIAKQERRETRLPA